MNLHRLLYLLTTVINDNPNYIAVCKHIHEVVIPKSPPFITSVANAPDKLIYILKTTNIPINENTSSYMEVPILDLVEGITYKFSILSELNNVEWETLIKKIAAGALRVLYTDKTNDESLNIISEILIKNPALLTLLLIEITPTIIDPYFLTPPRIQN